MKSLCLFFVLLLINAAVWSQESYEIQVYGSAVMPLHSTIFELHSNVSPTGPRSEASFTHPVHETLEITSGLAPNFELGFYMFTRMDAGFQYMGSHIRPRISVPDRWKWKMGASLSAELGFVKEPGNDSLDWDYEIRPILDKSMGKHYLSFNPSFDGSFRFGNISFSPNIKYAFTVKPKYALGFEYYGSLGSPLHWDKSSLQTHLFYAVADLFLHPDYEFSIGAGHGVTYSSDRWNLRLIMGKIVHGKK